MCGCHRLFVVFFGNGGCLLWSLIVIGVNVGVGVGIGLMDLLRCVLVIDRPIGVVVGC